MTVYVLQKRYPTPEAPTVEVFWKLDDALDSMRTDANNLRKVPGPPRTLKFIRDGRAVHISEQGRMIAFYEVITSQVQ